MFSEFREVSRTNSWSISESTLRVISFLTLRPDNNSDDELEMEELFYREYFEFFLFVYPYAHCLLYFEIINLKREDIWVFWAIIYIIKNKLDHIAVVLNFKCAKKYNSAHPTVLFCILQNICFGIEHCQNTINNSNSYQLCYQVYDKLTKRARLPF